MVYPKVIYPGSQPHEMWMVSKGVLGPDPLFKALREQQARRHLLGPCALFASITSNCVIQTHSSISRVIYSVEDYFFQIIIPTSRLCKILISSDIWKLSSLHQLKAIPWCACIHFEKKFNVIH